jgi:CBS domain-containing protein
MGNIYSISSKILLKYISRKEDGRVKLKDIMTESVAYLEPTSTVLEAAQLMQKHNVGSIPVCDHEKLVGIVTDRDIIVRSVAYGNNPNDTFIKDIMTSNVTTVSPDTDISQASKLMAENQIRRLPIVENDKLVGVVALGDLATNVTTDSEACEALSDISSPSGPQQM